MPQTPNLLVVIGSINRDISMYLETLPKPGETVGGGQLKNNLGGKGANQAMAALYAGAETLFIGCVGDDAASAEILAQLEDLGLDTSHITQIADAPSGTACIFVDAHAENCIGLTAGANDALSPELIESKQGQISQAGVMVLQLEIPMESIEAAASLASNSGQVVILNPAPAKPLSDSLLANVTLLTPNRGELELLSGMPATNIQETTTAAEKLLSLGVDIVLVTLGSEGALLVTAHQQKSFSAKQVTALDTTAAGDCFNGYLAAYIARHGLERIEKKEQIEQIEQAIEFAMAAAAISVTRAGAVESIPKLEEVEAFS